MSTSETKPEPHSEALKSHEDEGVLATIKKAIKQGVDWVRSQIAHVPGLGWLKPKTDPHAVVEKKDFAQVQHKTEVNNTGQDTHTKVEAKEAKESDTALKADVVGPSKYKDYIGLTEKMRAKLGVEFDQTVKVVNEKGDTKLFWVGKINDSEEHLAGASDEDKLTMCTIQWDDAKKVTIHKTTEDKIYGTRFKDIKNDAHDNVVNLDEKRKEKEAKKHKTQKKKGDKAA